MGIDLGRFKSNKNEEWVDWLADDPAPPSIRQKMRVRAVHEASQPIVRRPGQPMNGTTNSPQTSENQQTVSINITIPKINLKKPRIRFPERSTYRKPWVFGGLAVTVILAGAGAFVLVQRNTSDKSSGDTPAVLAQSDEKASFAFTLPKGKSEELTSLPRYDSQKKVVNFQDSIGGIAITISQQQLPEAFKEDTAERVRKLAEDFSATKTIPTANPTAYIGTSEKGPQTVIFAKKELLIFIQSAKKIDDHDWAEYITNLQ